jgi:single-stranded-DNA-specific exonuclease
MIKKTNIWKTTEIDSDTISSIIYNTGVSTLMATVLASRGFSNSDLIKDFLNPKLANLYSPYLLKDMEKSVERIIREIKNKGKILIYGDYDVDGVTSTTVLYNFLKSCGADVDYFIPDRMEEGYGLNMNAIASICKSKPSLIITVDNGVYGLHEVEYINQQGIDIIITDHHECPEILPNAYSIINPKQPDCPYPFKKLAGVGVAFKLAQALSQKLYGDNRQMLKYLDLVCLGTIADIVPLVEENRIFVKYGLKTIANTENIGLKALCDESGIKEIDSWSIGYLLAPRINAAGRLGEAGRAVELFVTDDAQRAESLAKELNQDNKNRQDIEARLTEEIIELISTNNHDDDNVLVIYGENWHHGVIGIVASRITEKYNKSCILISFEDEIGRGSGRSVDGINLFEILQKSRHMLEKYGGHEKAAGLTIQRKNIDGFKELVQKIAAEKLNEITTERTINIDAEINARQLDFKAVNDLKLMEPFGMENPAPLFTLGKLKIGSLRTVGDNKHLKLVLNSDGFTLEGIGFRMGELQNELEVGSCVDVVCSSEINTFAGRKIVQLNIKDLRNSPISSSMSPG